MTFQWDDSNIEQAKTLWLEGYSATQIARTLDGDLTRSAVIGKLNRLGVKRPATRITQVRTARRNRPAALRKPRPTYRTPSPIIAEPEPVYTGKPVHLTATGNRLCKFVLDDHGMCCGAPVKPGKPWCRAHYARVYVQVSVAEAAE